MSNTNSDSLIVPTEEIKIIVRVFNNRRSIDDAHHLLEAIVVARNDTIWTVKQAINRQLGIPPEEQRLYNISNNVFIKPKQFPPELDDSTLITVADDSPGTIWFALIPRSLTIVINRLDQESLHLVIDPDDRVLDIKERIERQEGIPVIMQLLICDGEVLPDGKFERLPTLSHPWWLVVPIQLHVQGRMVVYLCHGSPSQWTPVSVSPDEPIGEIRRRLCLNALANLDSTWDGTFADDDTLAGRSVKPFSKLRVLSHQRKMKITIERREGKNITLYVQFDEPIQSVKEMIRMNEGISPDTMRLIYAGRWLEDGFALNDYQVLPESTIILVTRLYG
jgi:hypothetical protein